MVFIWKNPSLRPTQGWSPFLALPHIRPYLEENKKKVLLWPKILLKTLQHRTTKWTHFVVSNDGRWITDSPPRNALFVCSFPPLTGETDNIPAVGHDRKLVTHPVTVNAVRAASSTAYSSANWQRLRVLEYFIPDISYKIKMSLYLPIMTPKRLRMGSLVRHSLCSEGALTQLMTLSSPSAARCCGHRQTTAVRGRNSTEEQASIHFRLYMWNICS